MSKWVLYKMLNLRHEILSNDEYSLYYRQWKKERKDGIDTKYIVLKCEGEDACGAYLSKCDYDPLHEHKNPYTLNFIYTREKFRNRGIATAMVLNHLQHMEISAFMPSPQMERIFKKCGWKNFNDIVYRSK